MNESYFPEIVSYGVELERRAKAPASHSDQSQLLSKALEDFITQEIRSLEQLEILLHMFQNPGEWWGASQVYEVVKSNVRSVEERLAQFANDQILEKDGCDPPRYRANTDNEMLRRVVTELDTHYHERRVRVVEFIYSRLSGAAEFARAFRIRKENES